MQLTMMRIFALVFGGLMLAMLTLAALGVVSARDTSVRLSEQHRGFVVLDRSRDVERAVLRLESSLGRYLASADVSDRREVEALRQQTEQTMNAFHALARDEGLQDPQAVATALADWLGHAGNAMRIMTATDELSSSREQLLRDVGTYAQMLARHLEARRATIADQAQATVYRQLGLGLAALVLALGAFAWLWFELVRPLRTLVANTGRIARSEEPRVLQRRMAVRELRDLSEALVVFRSNAAALSGLAHERQKTALAAERQTLLGGVAARFEEAIGGILMKTGELSDRLSAKAHAMSAHSADTAKQSAKAASASDEAAQSVGNAAAAAEQLSVAVTYVSETVDRSARHASNAAARTERSTELVAHQREAAGRIGEVLTLINALSSQTSLLSLNAAVEAARAGEAGRGFAVVANEIKALSAETAKATRQIADQINAIRQATLETSDAIASIAATVKELDTGAQNIATTIAQQRSAIADIAENAQRAASEALAASRANNAVSMATSAAMASADSVFDEAASIRSLISELDRQAADFLSVIRSGSLHAA